MTARTILIEQVKAQARIEAMCRDIETAWKPAMVEYAKKMLKWLEGSAPQRVNSLSDVWLVHKHKETGEILGPSVEFGVPTNVVHAKIVDSEWQECNGPNSVKDINARLPGQQK